ncbi:MAG: alpha/beta hydrolase [Solirubrobacteraceae bacterium]
MLIHGAGADANSWDAVVSDLATDHRVVTYNRRGYPGSGEPTAHWSRHRDDAAALLRDLETGPATVVGLSAGGIVALDLAVQCPELVSSLILIEPGVYGRSQTTPGLAKAFLSAQLTRRLRGEAHGVETFLRWATSYSTGGNAWDSPAYPEERRRAARSNASAMFADFALGDGNHIPRARLADLQAPVTLIVCDLSPSWFHKTADALAKEFSNPRLATIAGAGHALPFDRPDEIARIVRECTTR